MEPKTMTIACPGYDIVADWYDGDTARLLLVLPGYTSSRTDNASFVRAVTTQTGAAALVIDYSGHGDSPFALRDTRPAQHFLEVIYAFDWLKQQYPDATIWVTGSSYGGFLATQLTKYRKFDKLVLRAPAIYKPQEFYTTWAARIDNEEDYRLDIESYRTDISALTNNPLLQRASHYSGKTLVMVHGKDETVPTETTDAYIRAFKADSYTAATFTHSINKEFTTKEELATYRTHMSDWLIS